MVSLVNKMAVESNRTIIFVSHRKEPGLKPQFVYQLSSNQEGSTGEVMNIGTGKSSGHIHPAHE